MTSSANKELAQYRDRYIAFLDILGFTSAIEESIANPDAFKAAQDALNWIGKSVELGAGMMTSDEVDATRYYMFSDTVVITAPPTKVALSEMFENVAKLSDHIISSRLALRGSIVRGALCEDDKVLFGPGLVHAHRMESTIARYPRIVVADEIVEIAKTIPYEVLGRLIMSLDVRLRQDSDGQYFLDWLHHYHKIYGSTSKGFPTDAPINFSGVKQVIESWLAILGENPGVFEKWRWLATYFNIVVTEGHAKNILGAFAGGPIVLPGK